MGGSTNVRKRTLLRLGNEEEPPNVNNTCKKNVNFSNDRSLEKIRRICNNFKIETDCASVFVP